MAIDRRQLLAGAAGFAAVAVSSGLRAAEPALYASAYRDAGGFGLAVLDQTGWVVRSEPLPARGHGTAVSPSGRWVVHFARRPGRFARVLDMTGVRRSGTIVPPDDRRFCGHGFFSRDGRLLYATENDFDSERGVLGVYDTGRGFRRSGEIPTHGIGPHEAILLRNGRVAAVANGGIATHPDYPRMKLNLSDMRPSLSIIDLQTGSVADRAELPPALHQLSLRHLAEAGDGTIWIAGQYEGPPTDDVPLIALYGPGNGIRVLDAVSIRYRLMKQYVGSVAVNGLGNQVAVTSPRGGAWLVFDTVSQSLVVRRAVPDVSGAAEMQDGFLVTDGRGNLWRGGTRLFQSAGRAWDNHMTHLRSRFAAA